MDFAQFDAIVAALKATPRKTADQLAATAATVFPAMTIAGSIKVADLRQALEQMGEPLQEDEVDALLQRAALDAHGNVTAAGLASILKGG